MSSRHTSSKNTSLLDSPVPVKVMITLRELPLASVLEMFTVEDATHCQDKREGKGRVTVVRTTVAAELVLIS